MGQATGAFCVACKYSCLSSLPASEVSFARETHLGDRERWEATVFPRLPFAWQARILPLKHQCPNVCGTGLNLPIILGKLYHRKQSQEERLFYICLSVLSVFCFSLTFLMHFPPSSFSFMHEKITKKKRVFRLNKDWFFSVKITHAVIVFCLAWSAPPLPAVTKG